MTDSYEIWIKKNVTDSIVKHGNYIICGLISSKSKKNFLNLLMNAILSWGGLVNRKYDNCFNNNGVKSMNKIFIKTNLLNVDLSNIYTKNVEGMSFIFYLYNHLYFQIILREYNYSFFP